MYGPAGGTWRSQHSKTRHSPWPSTGNIESLKRGPAFSYHLWLALVASQRARSIPGILRYCQWQSHAFHTGLEAPALKKPSNHWEAQMSIIKMALWEGSDTELSRNIRQHGNENAKRRLQTQGLRGKTIKKKGGGRLLRTSKAVKLAFCRKVAFELAWGNGSADASNTFSGLRSQWTMFLKWRCRKATSIYKEDHQNNFISK